LPGKPLVLGATAIAVIVLMLLVAYLGRPQKPVHPDASWNQKDADFFRSDPKRTEEMRRNEKPWNGKGVDPNFPVQ